MDADAARRLEDALELADLAERLVEASLRREHPGWSDAEVDAAVVAWLQEQREEIPGDVAGDVRVRRP
jgi:hypothetical protein